MIKSTYEREMQNEKFKKAFDEAYAKLENMRNDPEYYVRFTEEFKKALEKTK